MDWYDRIFSRFIRGTVHLVPQVLINNKTPGTIVSVLIGTSKVGEWIRTRGLGKGYDTDWVHLPYATRNMDGTTGVRVLGDYYNGYFGTAAEVWPMC